MPDAPLEKPTHLLNVVFAIDGFGAHQKTFGWTPKPDLRELTADGYLPKPDPAGDVLNEKHPLQLEIRYAHGGITVIKRDRILHYDTKSVARAKAEKDAFGVRMEDADARIAEQIAAGKRPFAG